MLRWVLVALNIGKYTPLTKTWPELTAVKLYKYNI